MRYSYCVTSGNEPDLTLADYLNFIIDDPQTRQVALFIEGIRRPQAFMHAAGRALAMGKPVIAIKTGVTAKSQAASQSHTGAIAGDYQAYLAMCERYGVVNCRSLDDLVETALAFNGGRLPKGPRIGFVTTSGGTCDLLYDYADAEGAAMPDFTNATKATLKPLMQDGIAPKNPLDMGIPPPLDVAAKICETAAHDPNVDMVAWASPMPRLDGWGDVTPFRHAARQDRQADRRLRPPDPSGERASPCRAGEGRLSFPAGTGTDHPRAQCAVVSCGPPRPRAADTAARAAERSHAGNIGRRRSPATASRCRGARKPQPPPKRESPQNASGFPVVLKIRSPDILHKTEAGGVALDLRSRADGGKRPPMRSSHRRARRSLRHASTASWCRRWSSGVEAIVGARSDPLYGPMLLVGAGGVLVELARDAALRLLPVSADDVRAMVDGLKLAKLLAGYRGRPAADRAALETTALALGQFFLDHRAQHRGHRDQSAHGARKRRGRRRRARDCGGTRRGSLSDGFRTARKSCGCSKPGCAASSTTS